MVGTDGRSPTARESYNSPLLTGPRRFAWLVHFFSAAVASSVGGEVFTLSEWAAESVDGAVYGMVVSSSLPMATACGGANFGYCNRASDLCCRDYFSGGVTPNFKCMASCCTTAPVTGPPLSAWGTCASYPGIDTSTSAKTEAGCRKHCSSTCVTAAGASPVTVVVSASCKCFCRATCAVVAWGCKRGGGGGGGTVAPPVTPPVTPPVAPPVTPPTTPPTTPVTPPVTPPGGSGIKDGGDDLMGRTGVAQSDGPSEAGEPLRPESKTEKAN